MNQYSLTRMKYYSPLIAAALATASLFRFSVPVFAAGTEAGTPLRNTATATYENEDGSTTFEAISNEVTVTVGKIAGITNVPDGFVDNTTSNTTVAPGDSVSFDFLITNTGNDTTDIFIPNIADIVLSSNLSNPVITYGLNSPTSNPPTTPRPANGLVPDIVEDGSIIVRVTVDIDSNANNGDTISVTLGDTGLNDNGTDTQNQPDDTGSADPQNRDVRTVTADNASTDVDGDPVNGQREASAFNSTTIGSNPLALTRIEKTNSGVDDSGTTTGPTQLQDDIITYNLELDVANDIDPQIASYTNFPYNAADLEGRDYSLPTEPGNFDGIADQTNLILISDVIPENTTLDLSDPSNITSPANWTPVYTQSLLDTPAEEAQWFDDVANLPNPVATNPITRVGWVYDARTTGGNGAITAGSTTTGFSFKVVTSGLTNVTTSIYNMSQVFGSTDDGADGTTTGPITFDESGDQNPNNLNDDGTPGPDETVADGSGEYGVPDPGTNEDNVDTAGDNTATGSLAGEVNKVVVAPAAVVSDLLNGPENNPGATGEIFGANPADDNHDFQNLGVSTPPITGGTNQASTFDPLPVTFTNTLQNSTPALITDVILLPVIPTNPDFGGGTNVSNLPDGTVITITYDDSTNTSTAGNATLTATYTVTGGVLSNTGGTPDITIGSIFANDSIDYTVEVDLPATALSTNDNGSGGNVGGYAVPIVAFEDLNSNNTPDITDTYNVTVDQIYLGYLKLEKKARILRRDDLEDPTSTNYSPVAGMGFDDSDIDKEPIPGDRIEYQVTFTNISEPQGAGSNNVTLRADDIFITEDGTVGANNWAEDSDTPLDLMDTLNVPSSAAISGISPAVATNIRYFNGTNVGTTTDQELTKYEANIAVLNPGESGIFTFQRKVTEQYDIDTLIP